MLLLLFFLLLLLMLLLLTLLVARKNVGVCNVCVCFLITANAVNPREPALDALVEHLKTNIANKKSKNVDILFLAQEVGQVQSMHVKTENKCTSLLKK